MDQDLKQQLDRIEKFMMEHLATKQEVTELAGKLNTLTESVNKLTTAVDNLAKRINDFDDQNTTLKHQLLSLQDWAREVSKKVGIEFKL